MPEDTPVTCNGECCGLNRPDCGAENGGWGCTLPEKHEGPHIACGGGGLHNLSTWE